MVTEMHSQTLEKNDPQAKQWRMLLVYNMYRLLSIGALFGFFWLDHYSHADAIVYLSALGCYFIFGLLFLYVWYKKSLKFEQQVVYSGTVDVVVMVLFIQTIGYIQAGLGILLNAFIAVLSILVPGRLAIFFAAIASCMLLGTSLIQYGTGVHDDLRHFFSTGIYGASFFATALTAWYLASWVKSSEQLAQARAKELANVQRLNEYIVERLQHGVIYVDPNKQVKLINTAARRFFNWSENTGNLKLRDLSSALYDKYLQFLSHSKTAGQSAQTTIDNPYLQVHFFPASYGSQTAVLMILNDMTHIAQQAQELKLASLGRFSASIAHELRNPLGVIAHAVQLLGEEKELSGEDLRLKQLIINNCDRMNRVIKNVLQMSRRQQAQPETIELNSFLKQFKHDFCLINPCNLILKSSKEKRKTVVFDKSQLEQVLIILCDNSMQHGRNQAGEVDITLEIKDKTNKTLLLISDTGLGIPKKIRNHVFEPFFSTVRTGYGMGLFIAKDLCEINQAKLDFVECEIGCCFAISFNPDDEIRL
ncbi:two-component system sensor histidine kinase NtrB [Legionella septentrionalis]|nr:HAMP domain-containing sensor histidine kinase [Legionella septentrionalis]